MPGDRSLSLQVSGLREIVKALKGGEERLDLELRKRLAELAKDVAADARAMAAGLQPRVPERVLATLVGRAQATSADVKLGSNSVPYALGYEFGAAHNVPRTRVGGKYQGLNQFPTWRGSGSDAGYFLYPAIRKNRDRLMDELLDVIDDILAMGEAA